MSPGENPVPSSQLTSTTTTAPSSYGEESGQELSSTQTSLATEMLQQDTESSSNGDVQGAVSSELNESAEQQQRQVTKNASPPSLRLSLSLDGEATVRKQCELSPSSSHEGRNGVRIAMTSDGQAVVRAGAEPSPAKNRVSLFPSRNYPRPAGLRRSYSEVSFSNLSAQPSAFGRSRDPRNWRTSFDTDARSALSNGVGMRSERPLLVRSVSNLTSTAAPQQADRSFSGLMPIVGDANKAAAPQQQAGRRKKRKLSIPSLGQIVFHSTVEANGIVDDDDSDKENWIPGTRKAARRPGTMTTIPRRAQDSVLKDSGRTNRKDVGNNRRRSDGKPWGRGEKYTPHVSGEVSAFMDRNNCCSNEAEDLDCIEGLLSLSQGTWR